MDTSKIQPEKHKPATCKNCGETWPMDPALLVPCPVCNATVGAQCVIPRPSEHRLNPNFTGNVKGFNDGVHDKRDILAMETIPGYGKCTGKKCKSKNEIYAEAC